MSRVVLMTVLLLLLSWLVWQWTNHRGDLDSATPSGISQPNLVTRQGQAADAPTNSATPEHAPPTIADQNPQTVVVDGPSTDDDTYQVPLKYIEIYRKTTQSTQ